MLDYRDFKEVQKKDGTKVVFCQFEELLTDAYDVGTMEEVKPHATNSGEYIIHCPYCKAEGHTKHKLYIKDDLTVGHCFVCGRNYININDNVRVDYTIPDFSSFMNTGDFELVKLTDPTWTLDKYKYEFDSYDEEAIKYLERRNPFLKELYKILGFKFWEGNIVMPFFYHGEPYYYQIRFTGNSNIRYFFPPISNKGIYAIDHTVPENNLIICEGVYDAIACLIQAPDYIPIAVLGSSVSDYQLSMIREYVPKKIKIFMDETKISKKIYDRLITQIDYCPIEIIPSYGPDPEEVLNTRIKQGLPIQWIY